MYSHPSHTDSHAAIAVLSAYRAGATRQAVAVLSLDVASGAAASQLTPDGLFRARDGRPEKLPGWKMAPEIATRLIARLRARRTPIVVDYEHQTLLADQNGLPAPAAGWIDPARVEYREGEGLFAPIDWTDRAKSYIESGEYKFLSPVLPYDKNSGEILDLLHVALTNNPAVDGMAAVAALSTRFDLDPQQQESTPVTREQLISLLGLAADATDKQIEEGMAALKAKAESADALAADVAALKAQQPAKPDMSQYVPKAVHDETRSQLAALKGAGETAEVERLIEEGVADGRIAGKATADWLRTQGLAALKAHLEDAPTIAALKGSQTQGKKPDDGKADDELSEEELAVCKSMGMSVDDYKAARATA
jgi:phage I-like protein